MAEQVVAAARLWMGTPYRHQASSLGIGCDCLGLVRGVWCQLYGWQPEEPGPYSRDWAEMGGREQLLEAAGRHLHVCPADEISVGRLLVFRWRAGQVAKHVGIATAHDRFIHAYEGSAVIESSLVPSWRRRIAGVFAFPPVSQTNIKQG